MGRSRYVITEVDKPHFLTCTVVDWLPIFTQTAVVQIIFDCWTYQRQQQGLKLYGYVIMENHLHFVAQATRLDKVVHSFKSFTARSILDYLQRQHQEHWLSCMRLAKIAHKIDR